MILGDIFDWALIIFSVKVQQYLGKISAEHKKKMYGEKVEKNY